MNREDIIRMARKAGFNKTGRAPAYYAMPEEIEHFAALVAAAEREACAKVCDEIAKLPNDLMSDAPHIAAAIRARSNT